MVQPDVRASSNAGSSVVAGLIRTARPKQWLKNVLVFAAPAAAGVLNESEAMAKTIGAFVIFCLAAAGTYLVNDARDVEADRRHPKKRFRPVAAGIVSPGLATSVGAICIVGAVAAGFALRLEFGLTVAGYLVLTTLYTSWLKNVAPVDLVAVASGFVLRAIGGATATGVPISEWFFIVASAGSLFMVAGKRTGELGELGADARNVRSTLGEYTTSYLAYVRSVSSGVVLVAYCLWAFETAAVVDPDVPWFQLSVVPFAIAILRYAMLVDLGKGAEPEQLVLEDRILMLAAAAWAVIFGIGIYLT